MFNHDTDHKNSRATIVPLTIFKCCLILTCAAVQYFALLLNFQKVRIFFLLKITLVHIDLLKTNF